MIDHAELIPAAAETWRPEEVLSWAFATYGKDVAIASGFVVLYGLFNANRMAGMTLLFLALCLGAVFWVFKTGYKLKT